MATTSQNAERAAERASSVAKDSLKNMPQATHTVVEDAREMAEQGLDFINSNLEGVRKNATRYYKASENVIRENPFYAIAGAVAVGAIIGAFLVRPRR